MLTGSRRSLALAVLLLVLVGTEPLRADEGVEAPAAPTWFARIDGVTITVDEFAANMREGAKQKFYHGTPPVAAIEELKREVSERLIAQHLVIKAAREKGLTPDAATVAKAVTQFEQKNKHHPDWQQARVELVPLVTTRAEEDDIARQLQQAVRKVIPSEPEVKLFYDNNHALFTTPAKNHVKLILLELEPTSSAKDRERAEQKIKSIEAQLKAGASFERLARRHSSDATAGRGGDLGFLHQGQLSEQADAAIDKMKPGEISAPLQLLNGWAIVKLIARDAATLNPYDRVKERATALYERERAEQQWKDFVAQLRQKAVVEINPDL